MHKRPPFHLINYTRASFQAQVHINQKYIERPKICRNDAPAHTNDIRWIEGDLDLTLDLGFLLPTKRHENLFPLPLPPPPLLSNSAIQFVPAKVVHSQAFNQTANHLNA